MNKYFPTLQPHNFNKDISVYNKVVWKHVYSPSVLIYMTPIFLAT